MGMTIKLNLKDSENELDKFPTVEAIPKADYEARLKSDMVAMLTELQLEIEELDNPLDYDFEGYNQCAVDCQKLIQQKIDKLKEAKDGENNY
jgi:FtsZ-binding cell division protein ZapB